MEITNWRKSSRSYNYPENCVETGWSGDVVGYRDTKQAALPDTERPILLLPKNAAHAFLRMITT
jgi:hypothetical protein